MSLDSNPKPRLLFLCQTLPYPPDGGVQIRAFHLLRVLATDYDVAVLCFYRASARRTAEEVRHGVAGLKKHAGAKHAESFPIPQEHSRARFLWDHLRSVLTRRPYTVFTYESAAFRKRLNDLLSKESFDLIHVDSLDLSGYLRGLPDRPIICDHHNVESALLRARAQQERGVLRRSYLLHQTALLKREETKWCERVDLNLAVSSKDREVLLRGSPGARVTVVPNGVDTTTFQPTYDGDNGIVFVGGRTWFPNRDGMEYFAHRILPLIRERMGPVPVCWVGRASQPVAEHYWKAFGIRLTGFVDDIRPFVQPAACFIVPLRVGGGTRLKILDAWAMGKAVVSTSLGCEGLDAHDGENILVRDDDTGFAEAVRRVLEDKQLRLRLGRAGRATVEEAYDWDVVGRRMLGEFRQLLRDSQATERSDPRSRAGNRPT